MVLEYLAPVKHVIPLTTIRRERLLPVPGTVAVRVREKVQAQDVLAEADAQPRHIFIDVARGLGVAASQVPQLVTRERGERVEIGDIIAGPVGLARRTVRAPADGRIAALSEGRVLFEVRGRSIEVRAGFPAVVVATDGTRLVTVETTGALIQAAWGNGRQDFGVMRVIGDDPGEPLVTDKLDINLRGAVIVAGNCDNPAPLHQATELSVRGLILGSMASDLIPVVRRLPYAVLILEGFGRIPINSAAYALITSNVGREVAVDARPAQPYDPHRPEMIIPLPASREVGLPDEVVLLVPGVRVRVTRDPYHGAVGVVRELLEHAVEFPSGILARSANVELEGIGDVPVPLANLEVLQ